ncbi:stage V sporulation protein AB [Bacillus solitudinis]|uniref:stage V sporulation protein AB n=1 Tax=Bacillus solitudinis TaxID=2014074 RepID=UPI000C241D0A|nr:stage V sporulation protein AB [Bacillus solitudinis]
MVIESLFVIFLGLSGGLAVGSGLVAFLTMLGIVPRLTQLTRTQRYIHFYEWALIIGVQFGTWSSFYNYELKWSALLTIPIGLAAGMFIGMLAAALTEVLNVLPILAKRVGIAERMITLLMAIVFGKIIGSLFQWLYFVD